MADELAAATRAADFVTSFAAGWALAKPEGFVAHFRPRFHAEVVATQPLFPPAHGPAELERMFRRFFSLFPDLTLTVDRWTSRGDAVTIESTCRGTLGGRPIRFAVCDCFVLCDGQIRERRSYLDPLPLLRSVLLRPWVWWRALRAVLGATRVSG
jgi:ketosteroid isomerase-like protein